MNTHLSDKCKQHLRHIEGTLFHIIRNSTAPITREDISLLNVEIHSAFRAASDDLDDECKRILEGLEAEMQNLQWRISNDAYGSRPVAVDQFEDIIGKLRLLTKR